LVAGIGVVFFGLVL